MRERGSSAGSGEGEREITSSACSDSELRLSVFEDDRKSGLVHTSRSILETEDCQRLVVAIWVGFLVLCRGVSSDNLLGPKSEDTMLV